MQNGVPIKVFYFKTETGEIHVTGSVYGGKYYHICCLLMHQIPSRPAFFHQQLFPQSCP
jgi:hypothetical protein